MAQISTPFLLHRLPQPSCRRPATPPNWHPAFQGVGDSQPKNRLSSASALPSLHPAAKAQGWRSGEKHPAKPQPQRRESGGIFEAGGAGMRYYQGDAEHRLEGPCLTSRFWRRDVSTTFSMGAVCRAPPPPLWGCRDRTEPHGLSLPSGMLSPADPQPKRSSRSWLPWQISWQLPRCSPLGNSLQPSRYPAEAFASTVCAISGSRNHHLQVAKPHRTVFNRNFIDIEDPHRTLMNT